MYRRLEIYISWPNMNSSLSRAQRNRKLDLKTRFYLKNQKRIGHKSYYTEKWLKINISSKNWILSMQRLHWTKKKVKMKQVLNTI